MKQLVILFSLFIAFSSNAQSIVNRKALMSIIKVPIPDGWQKIDDEVAKNIRTTKGTYNIISIYKGEVSDNLVSLYGDSGISRLFLSNADFERIRTGFEKRTLPELAKISMKDVPLERVLSILKQFYKDDPKKYEIAEQNKEAMISKGTVSTMPPVLTSLNSNGFYYLLPVTIELDKISYSFYLIIGYLRLNKYSYGLSGSVEETNKDEFDKFVKTLLIQNLS